MLIEPSSSYLASDKNQSIKYKMDNPPDYSEKGEGSMSSRPPLPPPKVTLDSARSSFHPPPQTQVQHQQLEKVPPHPPPTADQVHIFERDGNIQGRFFIDPSLQALDQSHRKKLKGKSKDQLPHASFRSHQGTIKLELGTTGNVNQTPKANITVSSKSGGIKIDILSMHPTRPQISVETESKSGNIVIFLPSNFVGVVHLSSRKRQANILPALRSISRMVKSTDQEAIFMIGGHEIADQSREASFCQATSRTGSIIVGLSGKDIYEPEIGFWKKLGNLFRGESQAK